MAEVLENDPRVSLKAIIAANKYSAAYERLVDLIEFDGPPIWCIGDAPYTTFTQYGVKAEGEQCYPGEETRCWTEAEAIWRFKRALAAHLVANPGEQLAWRIRPTVECRDDGDYVVRCRFALVGQPRAQVAA